MSVQCHVLFQIYIPEYCAASALAPREGWHGSFRTRRIVAGQTQTISLFRLDKWPHESARQPPRRATNLKTERLSLGLSPESELGEEKSKFKRSPALQPSTLDSTLAR
ncbi:hypothetical protein VTK26DRAFT_7119 [Humicola hyalothermophila]